ncbi:MAG: hypothetical protein LWW85_02715 [Marinilabiliales bacterium]|nr:hypothetical protein [Marinilabiliales bacterium]
MSMTRAQYEAKFLDYLEGRLDRIEKAEVDAFLEQHPDLANEMQCASAILVPDPAITFRGKSSLKKGDWDDRETFEEKAAATLEGDLSEEEAKRMMEWANGKPEAIRFIKELATCKLIPDRSLHYAKKEQLKKRAFRPVYLLPIVGVAASLLLVLWAFPPGNQHGLPQTPPQVVIAGIPPAPSQPQENNLIRVKQVDTLKMKSMHRRKSVRKEEPSVQKSGAVLQKIPAEPLAALKPIDAPLSQEAQPILVLAKVNDKEANHLEKVLLSDYFESRLQDLKLQEPEEKLSRKEITLAGLRFLSRLTGKRFTARKDQEGKLHSISFQSQLLAISFPVNTEE